MRKRQRHADQGKEHARHEWDKSRIGGVNGSMGEASRKSARSQLKW